MKEYFKQIGRNFVLAIIALPIVILLLSIKTMAFGGDVGHCLNMQIEAEIIADYALEGKPIESAVNRFSLDFSKKQQMNIATQVYQMVGDTRISAGAIYCRFCDGLIALEYTGDLEAQQAVKTQIGERFFKSCMKSK